MKVFLGLGILVLFIVIGGFSWFQTLWNNPSDFLNSADSITASWLEGENKNESEIAEPFIPNSSDSGLSSENTNSKINNQSYTDLPQTEPSTNTVDDWLTPAQREKLELFGIDTNALPTTLTPELELCFVKAIGVDRVEAIKNGDTPSFFEMTKAVTCL